MARHPQSCQASDDPAKWVEIPGSSLKVAPLAGVADSEKPARREIASVPGATTVEAVVDLTVVDASDSTGVSTPIEEMNLKQGDTILCYARFWEGLCQEDAQASCCTKDEGGPFGATL